MQLSLPEHRLQELKARSIMHTSWIFIPAIIFLSLLASPVHKRQRQAEGGSLVLPLASSWVWKWLNYERCFDHSLSVYIYIYIYMQGMMSWVYRDYLFRTCPSFPSLPSAPHFLLPFFFVPPTPLPHFWTSSNSDIFPNCHCCSRFLTHRSHSKAIPYRAYWKRTSSTILSPFPLILWLEEVVILILWSMRSVISNRIKISRMNA